MRRVAVLVSVIAILAAGGVFWSASSAEESTTLGFDVVWTMEERANAGDPCEWSESTTAETFRETGVSITGFPGSVTIKDAMGTIVFVNPLQGSYIDERSCHLAVDASVPTSAAHTIEVNGHYIATIREGTSLGTGDDRPVVGLLD